MNRLTEVIRLYRQGVSARRRAVLLRIGRNTLRQYEAAFGAAGVLEGSPDDLPDEGALAALLAERLPPKAGPQEVSTVAAWEAEIGRLQAKGVGPKVIYDTLRQKDPTFAGSYDAVKRLFRQLRRKRPPTEADVVIPVSVLPGTEAQVDFGYVGELYDPATRRMRKAWVFVLVLSHSRWMWADLVFDQRAETWQRLHAAAFAALGGVPAVLRPDNLKAAVVRAAFGVGAEPELNRSYVELARYYHFQVDPTPPRAPKKKGKVERAVQYVKRAFFAPRDLGDLDAGRTELGAWLTDIANARVHGTTQRVPAEVFEAVERAALKPLPALAFAPVVWRVATVHPDSHVQFDRALYSVPWRLLGARLHVRAKGQTVEIHGPSGRIATHERQPPGGRSTLPGHLPELREALTNRDRRYWEDRARRLGEDVHALIVDVFEAEGVLLPLRRVQGLVTALERVSVERASAAARRARFYQSYSVGALKDMLRRGLDAEPLPGVLIPTHGALEAPRFARSPLHFSTPIAES